MAKKLKVKTQKSENCCIILVAFERDTNGDEIDVLTDNFKRGGIKTDPEKDLEGALAEQLAIELQESHNKSLAGSFQVKKVRLNREFDRDRMGYVAPKQQKLPKENATPKTNKKKGKVE